VGVVALVLVGILIYLKSSVVIRAGNGRAPITWVSTPGNAGTVIFHPQDFAGDIGGHALTGRVTISVITRGHSSFVADEPASSTIVINRHKGRFAGKPFGIDQPFRPYAAESASNSPFVYGGTYDGQQIHVTLGNLPRPELTSSMVRLSRSTGKWIPFFGTIGEWQVKGFFHSPIGSGRTRPVTVLYMVSS
jgi:hypothetical protein